MNGIRVLGFAAGVLTASSLLPQVLKILKEKKTEDISVGMILILMTGVATWIVYGVLRDDIPIIATNAFSLFLNITTLGLVLKYKGKNAEENDGKK